jgi:hypothetical protein
MKRIAAAAIFAMLGATSFVDADKLHGTSAIASRCADAPEIPVRNSTWIGDVDAAGQVKRDLSKPVPSKAEIINAWRRRQNNVASFQFAWTEEQCHRRGWLPNPRYPEREWLAIPALRIDRTYAVTKSLTVSGNSMRYTFDLDRAEEPDGVDVVSPNGDNRGLGVRRHYSYSSSYDGQRDEIRVTSLLTSPPPAIERVGGNIDAQNLDTRAIMLAFRPLDGAMGHLLIDRAVTNERRAFYRGRSTFLLEERHDPSGWKTILWIEPERDFVVSRLALYFEQHPIVDMDIDYRQDARWGWLPSGWRIIEMLADGTRRLSSAANVTNYSINTLVH